MSTTTVIRSVIRYSMTADGWVVQRLRGVVRRGWFTVGEDRYPMNLVFLDDRAARVELVRMAKAVLANDAGLETDAR